MRGFSPGALLAAFALGAAWSCTPVTIYDDVDSATGPRDGGGRDRAIHDLVGRDLQPAFDVNGVDLASRDHSILVQDAGTGHDARVGDAALSSCQQPRKAGGESSLWVVNGTREPTLLPLSDAQKRSLVNFTSGSTGQFCSGTLVAPRYVLTAKHCTQLLAATQVTAQFSTDGVNIVRNIQVAAYNNNSTADVSVWELSQDAVALASAQTIPITPNTTTSAWEGTRVECAGWGTIEPGGAVDGRYFTAEPVYDVSGSEITVNGENYHGLCFGDSGGPVMGLISGEIRVLGVLSNGDNSCVGLDRYARVDVVRSWIEQFTGATPPIGGTDAGSGCGSVTSAGYCESSNTRAVYCANNQVQQVDCSAQGLVCGYSASASGYRCIQNTTDPCQGIDGFGACQGNVSSWCSGGVLRSFDCGACGWVCGWLNDEIGNECFEPCNGIDYLGQCQGTVAVWCAGSALRRHDCADEGKTCGWIDADTGYFCQ